MTTNHPFGQSITQPATSATDHFDILRFQTDFLFQFSIHRLFDGLSSIDPALRKLPSILPDALGPEHLALAIGENNPHIGAESILIDHASTTVVIIRSLFHKSVR